MRGPLPASVLVTLCVGCAPAGRGAPAAQAPPAPLLEAPAPGVLEADGPCEAPWIDIEVVAASRRLPAGLSYEVRAPGGATAWSCAEASAPEEAVPASEARCARACDWYQGPGAYELRVGRLPVADDPAFAVSAPIVVEARSDTFGVVLRFGEEWPQGRRWLAALLVRRARAAALDGVELLASHTHRPDWGPLDPRGLEDAVAFRLVNGSRETLSPEDRGRGFVGRLERRTAGRRERVGLYALGCGEDLEPQPDLAPGGEAEAGLRRGHILGLFTAEGCCPLPPGRYELVVPVVVVRSVGSRVARPDPSRLPTPRVLDVYEVSHDLDLTAPLGGCPFVRPEPAPPCPGSPPP